MTNRGTGGGAATEGGVGFQDRVAAYFATHILAEDRVQPHWRLPATVTMEHLRCETRGAVDDLLVVTSEEGVAYIQAKRAVSLSTDASSDLASALNQFVRRYLAHSTSTGTEPWDRPLDHRDRLVLAVSPECPATVRAELAGVLDRLRDIHPTSPMTSAATNKKEEKAFEVASTHVRRCWQEQTGSAPSDAQLRAALSFVHVTTLDVEAEGSDARASQNWLRQVVLDSPIHAGAAWNTLTATCNELARTRSGMGRTAFQDRLAASGNPVKSTPSFRTDLRALVDYTASGRGLLQEFARIRVSGTQVAVQRPVVEELRRCSVEHSVLVVGDPGAGKSGALHGLLMTLADGHSDHVLFSVDRLAAKSLGELRSELGLHHELVDVLKEWRGEGPAYLVIDALDAARAEESAQTLRDLIVRVVRECPRWRVIASIRKHDLRYGQGWSTLFLGTPSPQFQDAEFSRVSHVNIGCFTDDELGDVVSQSPDLGQVLDRAGSELRGLLAVPFNLHLVGELISDGVSAEDLSPIKTQDELLDRYWRRRILEPVAMADAREQVLSTACNEMVRRRELQMARSPLQAVDRDAALNSLLSLNVLREIPPPGNPTPDRYRLGFSHHLLFDYAVARLLLRERNQDLLARFENDSELLVVIRPSFLMHLRYLWGLDGQHQQFWELVLLLSGSAAILDIGKVVGPTVAAELARTPPDVQLLSHALSSTGDHERQQSVTTFRHLVGALTDGRNERPIAGPDAGPWCEFLEGISRDTYSQLAFPSVQFLALLAESHDGLTTQQIGHLAVAAGQLLQFAWSLQPGNEWLVGQSLRALCRCYRGCPPQAEPLLRQAIAEEHLQHQGYCELRWIADEVVVLAQTAPALVGDIYVAAFAHQEVSDAQTALGGSAILSLVSNRKQDYDGGLYRLATLFPQYFRVAPVEAAEALIGIIGTHVARRRGEYSYKDEPRPFQFGGRQAFTEQDGSSIWDGQSREFRHDDELRLIDAFHQEMVQLAGSPEGGEVVERVVDAVVMNNRASALWRRLLLLGIEAPDVVGVRVLPLASAGPILVGGDTSVDAGEFIRVMHPRCDAAGRAAIETAIMQIPIEEEDHPEHLTWVRSRLLGCLDAVNIVSDDVRDLLAELRQEDAIPDNEPEGGVFMFAEGEVTPRDWLAREGVPVDDPANSWIADLEAPLREFLKRPSNIPCEHSDIPSILPHIEALCRSLQRADEMGVHELQQTHAWDQVADACSRLAAIGDITCDEEIGRYLKSVLLQISGHPCPQHEPRFDAEADNNPRSLHWGRPAPRVEAVDGLLNLAHRVTCCCPVLLEAIERLAHDSVPVIRSHVAARLLVLLETAPDLMWKLVEEIAANEPRRGVLVGLVAHTLGPLAYRHEERVAALTHQILARVSDGPGSKEVREGCISLICQIYLHRGNQPCAQTIQAICAEPTLWHPEVKRVILDCSSCLSLGAVLPVDPAHEGVRQRAWSTLGSIVSNSTARLNGIQEQHGTIPFAQWPPEYQETARQLADLLEEVAQRIYFASGAFEERRQSGQRRAGVPETAEERRRFYHESREILDSLSTLGQSRIAHHLVETLATYAPAFPEDVLPRIADAVVRAEQGYRNETLGAALVVRIVNRCLADHRPLLKSNEAFRRAVLSLLDVFVRAGWPEARVLTYHLEDIFR